MSQMTPAQQAFATHCEQYREPARSKMLRLIPRIDGHEYSTFSALVGEGQGLSDRVKRASEAFKLGLFVRRADNTFGWPDSAHAEQVAETKEAERRVALGDAYRGWLQTQEEGEFRTQALRHGEPLMALLFPDEDAQPSPPTGPTKAEIKYAQRFEGDETPEQTTQRIARKARVGGLDPANYMLPKKAVAPTEPTVHDAWEEFE